MMADRGPTRMIPLICRRAQEEKRLSEGGREGRCARSRLGEVGEGRIRKWEDFKFRGRCGEGLGSAREV